jgi:hypothetical protein
MGDDHVCAHQLRATGHHMLNERTVVGY